MGIRLGQQDRMVLVREEAWCGSRLMITALSHVSYKALLGKEVGLRKAIDTFVYSSKDLSDCEGRDFVLKHDEVRSKFHANPIQGSSSPYPIEIAYPIEILDAFCHVARTGC